MTTSSRDAISTYVACVFEQEDIVEIRFLASGKQVWCQARELADIVEDLIQANQEGQGVFIGANPRKSINGSKAADVSCGRCIFVDLDDITVSEANERISGANLPAPTLLVNSGHGAHAFLEACGAYR